MAQLQFKGKQFVQNHHLSVKYHQLVPRKEKSVTDKVRLDDNLIIHGDNLLALKALLPHYAGKVKCVYIDPPYNTGNEKWVYNDNVNSPMLQEWLLTRHDKWLCLMTPRLKMLRELLAEDGVIFVSIDDSEAARLRLLMDEIFGPEKFIAQFCWKSRQNKDNRNETNVSADHEYILCYGLKLRGAERKAEQFSNPDNDPRGDWTSGNMVGLASEEARPNLHYDLVDPKTKIVYKKPTSGWRYDKKRMAKLIEEQRILWPGSPTGRPRVKVFLKEMTQDFTGLSTVVGDKYFTRHGTIELEEIFGKRELEFPKPSGLIRELITQATDDNSIVLDSFAGSGTTAHATLALNAEDGGNRRYILIECEDYADTITAERVRRVIKGVKGAKDENLRSGLGGTFSYFELGDPIEIVDLLAGKKMPAYKELARYLFYTATGEEFAEKKMDRERNLIGESKQYQVYLFYEPDSVKLKNIALTLERAKTLGKPGKKRRLVFAPTKYLDQEQLDALQIDFAQLPFEIYQRVRNA